MLSMLMCIQILVQFCPFILKILSRNEILTSIKGRNSAANLRKMTLYNLNLDLINVNVYTVQNLVKLCPLVLKILSGNEILTSIKGHNSVANLGNLTLNNPNQDIIYVNVHTKFGSILSIGSQDIERKRKSNINQGP